MACKKVCDIGGFKHRIDLIKLTSVRSTAGTRTQTFSKAGSVWARIEPKKKNPFLEGQNKIRQTTHKITVRNTTLLDEKGRIRFGTRFFFIKSFFNINEDNDFFEIEAVENVDAVVTVS